MEKSRFAAVLRLSLPPSRAGGFPRRGGPPRDPGPAPRGPRRSRRCLSPGGAHVAPPTWRGRPRFRIRPRDALRRGPFPSADGHVTAPSPPTPARPRAPPIAGRPTRPRTGPPSVECPAPWPMSAADSGVASARSNGERAEGGPRRQGRAAARVGWPGRRGRARRPGEGGGPGGVRCRAGRGGAALCRGVPEPAG